MAFVMELDLPDMKRRPDWVQQPGRRRHRYVGDVVPLDPTAAIIAALAFARNVTPDTSSIQASAPTGSQSCLLSVPASKKTPPHSLAVPQSGHTALMRDAGGYASAQRRAVGW